MYADYDTSSTIDDIDLAFFVQGLESDDLQYELGPVVGTPPHFNANLDAKYDIEDLMAFIMMWNWYVSNIGSTFNEYITMGEEVHIESAFDSIIVNIPDFSKSDCKSLEGFVIRYLLSNNLCYLSKELHSHSYAFKSHFTFHALKHNISSLFLIFKT